MQSLLPNPSRMVLGARVQIDNCCNLQHMECFDGLQPESESRIRHRVGRLVYSFWTDGGSNDSGLAAPLFDGRIDLLGRYTMGLVDDDDDDDVDDDYQDDEHNRNSGERAEHCSSRDCGGGVYSVPRIHCRDLSYERFTSEFMYPNMPVLIQGLTDTWRACQDWVETSEDPVNREGGGGEKRMVPNLKYLVQEFGSDCVPVHVQTTKGFGPTRPIPTDMTVQEYGDWWYSYHSCSNGSNVSAPNLSEAAAAAAEAASTALLYLKDWKFVAAHVDYNAYEWPIYFRDDWLNLTTRNAYKFVYLGPG